MNSFLIKQNIAFNDFIITKKCSRAQRATDRNAKNVHCRTRLSH